MSEAELVKSRFELLYPAMNDGMCRLWAACEANVLGLQGVAIVAAATGLSVETIRQGQRELKLFNSSSPNKKYTPLTPQGRIRRPGGGRKRAEVKDPELLSILESLVENDVAGDPMSEQKWIRNSLGKLSQRLEEQGHPVSPGVISRLLTEGGFSMKANTKRKVHSKSPERDEQFTYIALQ